LNTWTVPNLAKIIIFFNEEINIRDCVQAVLNSELDDLRKLEVWMVNDESEDRTGAIAQAIAATDARVKAISVPPCLQDEIWRGKNCEMTPNFRTGS
jgi:glycosyltransferase involved in cell wall biosynthesis